MTSPKFRPYPRLAVGSQRGLWTVLGPDLLSERRCWARCGGCGRLAVVSVRRLVAAQPLEGCPDCGGPAAEPPVALNRRQRAQVRSSRALEHGGRLLTLDGWSRRTGISKKILTSRIYERGWTLGRALSEAVRTRKKAP